MREMLDRVDDDECRHRQVLYLEAGAVREKQRHDRSQDILLELGNARGPSDAGKFLDDGMAQSGVFRVGADDRANQFAKLLPVA